MKMTNVAISLILLASMSGGLILVAEDAGADQPIAPTTRYVATSDSTYTSVQDAIDDSAEGDMIYIANGTYNGQLNIGTSHLHIEANYTDEVKITPDVTGPTAYVGSVTNITLVNINFTSPDSQAMRVHLSDNITMISCTFWSGGGTAGSLFIDENENITIMGDLSTGFTVIHSESDFSDALKIQDSEFIFCYIAQIESRGNSAAAVALYNKNSYVVIAMASIGAKGMNSDAIEVDTVDYGMAWGILPIYTQDIVDINSGRFITMGVNVPDADVRVGSAAELGVFNERLVIVMDENDDPIEGADMKMVNSWEGEIFATSHFGGVEGKSDDGGEFDHIPVLNRIFLGSNTPTWGQNDITVYYDGGDFPVTMATRVDANTSDDLEITLADFEIPEEAVNVKAETISHEQIDLSFEASPALDIDHYEIWVDSGMGSEWDLNTTIAGTYPYLGMVPDMNYSFKVIAVDDMGYGSDGITVWNMTYPPVNGTIEGMVKYMGGPMDGMPAVGATVTLGHSIMELLITTTVNETGFYSFDEVKFSDGYLMNVEPVDVVEDMGTGSGYISWEGGFEHTAPLVKNVSIPYYTYDSDEISGMIIYSGGPIDGMNATNATVFLYNETMVEIENTTVGEDGMYLFSDIEFGINYTLKATPVSAVPDMGTGSGYVSWMWTFNHTGSLEKNISLSYYDYHSDDIKGKVIYMGGDKNGLNATNATVFLYNGTMVEIANATVGEDGMYLFSDIEFGINHTLKVIPVSAVEMGGTKSGYTMNMTELFNHTGILTQDFYVQYYLYVEPAPTTGSISGTVIYEGGAKDGTVISGAKVSLIDGEGVYINTTTNATGGYLFEDVTFGDYAIEVFPSAAEQGETDVKSGYMGKEVAEFTFDSATGIVEDVSLVYYKYTPPVTSHPSVTIEDEDGEPLEGVLVTVTIGDKEYTATTGADGVAIFDQLEGGEFPEGTEFKASLDDHGTIEWSVGEDVPNMKEDKEEDNTLIFILIAVVILVLLIVVFMAFRKKDDGAFEE